MDPRRPPGESALPPVLPRLPTLILAAGLGARWGGRAKALLATERGTSLAHIAETCSLAGLAPVVVTGAHREAVEAEARRLRIPSVHNAAWEGGRTGSIQAGWLAVGRGPVLVWPVDIPLVGLDAVDAVLRAGTGLANDAAAVVPQYRGRGGHPVYLGAGLRDEVLALGRDTPLHDVVRRRLHPVPVDDAQVLLDLNEPSSADAWVAGEQRGVRGVE